MPVPFRGDRLNLKNDQRWSKVAAEYSEQRVVWADNIIKINRNDGKVLQHNVMVLQHNVMVLQHNVMVLHHNMVLLRLITAAMQAAPHLMSVTGKCVYVLDIKTFAVKSRIELSDLESVSLSAHSDGTCVLHIDQVRLLVH